MTISDKVLFSWLHLSDLHFGHGSPADQWDQRTVLGLLLNDIRKARTDWPELPAIDAVMVTGDIAFSGATDEYDRADAWLDKVREVLDLQSEDVYMVAGNHDVQRGVEIDLWSALRAPSDDLDAALDRGQGPDLAARQANFASFAQPYGARDPMGWTAEHRLPAGGRLRIVGVNTALLAGNDEDRGKLIVAWPCTMASSPCPPATDKGRYARHWPPSPTSPTNILARSRLE